MQENIIQKIIDNKNKIVGIRFNGIFYDVDFVGVDGKDCYDQFSRYDAIISAHQVDEFDCVLKYEFRVGNIQDAQDIKLYRLEEI